MTDKMKTVMADLKVTTKVLIGLIISLAGAMQLDVVKNYVTPILAAHPKLSSGVASLAGLGLLLQNPKVQKVLGIDHLLGAPPDPEPEPANKE